MSRPRHREKSNLLWKMLGIAAAINLLLWPILVHEGIFAGIRREVLIPVTLVSLPPSHKLPDTLQRIARTPPVLRPSAPPALSVPHRRQIRPVLPPVAVAAVVPPRSDRPVRAPEKKAIVANSLLHRQAVAPTTAPVSVSILHAEDRTSPSRPAPVAHSSHAPRPVNPLLAARIARAKDLEAQGHRVAEWIARQRTRAGAALPPAMPSAPTPVAEVSTTPPVPAESPTDHSDGRPPLSRFTPALAVWKAYPVVPDAMMKSAWHATFRGVFTVHQDGHATVTMVSSTGFPILDQRALGAARRWKFQPAQKNGVAVVSSQPFAFEYDVHPIR